jgi:hypothetical protein
MAPLLFCSIVLLLLNLCGPISNIKSIEHEFTSICHLHLIRSLLPRTNGSRLILLLQYSGTSLGRILHSFTYSALSASDRLPAFPELFSSFTDSTVRKGLIWKNERAWRMGDAEGRMRQLGGLQNYKCILPGCVTLIVLNQYSPPETSVGKIRGLGLMLRHQWRRHWVSGQTRYW